MSIDLETRLRSADPAGTPTPGQGAIDHAWLTEQARTAALSGAGVDRRPRSTQTRIVLAAAAATAVVAGVGVVSSGLLADSDRTPQAATPPALELSLGASSPSLGSCIRFSVEDLARMPVAFSGTVVSTSGDQILLDVDRWYRGGAAQQVSLVSPDGSVVSLEGTIPFEVGQRYLLTATDGVINFCGFSAPWSPEMADDFAAAFPAD